jgi:hypothetical protein
MDLKHITTMYVSFYDKLIVDKTRKIYSNHNLFHKTQQRSMKIYYRFSIRKDNNIIVYYCPFKIGLYIEYILEYDVYIMSLAHKYTAVLKNKNTNHAYTKN